MDVSLLLQALPYINRFRGARFIVKLGGELVQDPDHLEALAQDIALLQRVGIHVVLVHGGGPQASQLSERLGLEPRFVGGRRVTDRETLEVAKMVFAGKINIEILSALRRQGLRAVGLSGVAAGILHARRRPATIHRDDHTGEETSVDYGHVGDVLGVDVELLELLLGQDYVPVVSSLGADDDGNIYNINADSVAAELALALQAGKLLLVSRVPGVLEDPKDESTVIQTLSRSEARRLAEKGSLGAGMLPKLAAALRAVEGGVARAHILGGAAEEHALLVETFTTRGAGTMILGPEEQKAYRSETGE